MSKILGGDKDLTEISKKSNANYHDEPTNHTTDNSMKNNIKLVSDKGLEGSKTSSKRPDSQIVTLDATKNSNFVPKTKENQRRERDSNPRDLAVTSFM